MCDILMYMGANISCVSLCQGIGRLRLLVLGLVLIAALAAVNTQATQYGELSDYQGDETAFIEKEGGSQEKRHRMGRELEQAQAG